MEIEILFDTYKNLLHADRTYMYSDNEVTPFVRTKIISQIRDFFA